MGAILKGLLTPKNIIYAVIIIILLIILFKVFKNINVLSDKVRRLFKSYQGDFTDPTTKDEKEHLRDLAAELNSEIYSSINTGVTNVLKKILLLNDSDFIFLCKYYNNYFENTIYEDVDNEFLPFDNDDELFLSRYKGIGL